MIEEKERLFSHWAGQASALESFTGKLKLLAGEAFARNQDDRAKIIREIAMIAEIDAIECRMKQKANAT